MSTSPRRSGRQETNGEKFYSAELLLRWKSDHEGADTSALANILVPSEGQFFDYLSSIFVAPIEKLEKIAKQLETTGTLNANSVAELQRVVRVLQSDSISVDANTARTLAFAAEIFGSQNLRQTASSLVNAAEVLPSVADRLERAARRVSGEY